MRVVIAEDQALLREGLARLFRDGGHHVVATLRDADQLLATIEREQPDLAVIDIRMPPSVTDEGARAARAVKEQRPAVGVLLLSQHIETTHTLSAWSRSAGSATSSKTACSKWTSSSRRPSASRREGQPSTRWWSPTL